VAPQSGAERISKKIFLGWGGRGVVVGGGWRIELEAKIGRWVIRV